MDNYARSPVTRYAVIPDMRTTKIFLVHAEAASAKIAPIKSGSASKADVLTVPKFRGGRS
tara:strand:+ start:51291 stop:51470 length:180 start_codon:yes stop_codon:yes gene_type:complete